MKKVKKIRDQITLEYSPNYSPSTAPVKKRYSSKSAFSPKSRHEGSIDGIWREPVQTYSKSGFLAPGPFTGSRSNRSAYSVRSSHRQMAKGSEPRFSHQRSTFTQQPGGFRVDDDEENFNNRSIYNRYSKSR